MTYDLLNMYLDDNENCKYAINEKYHNRPDDVEHSSGLIVEERNHSETIVNISWKKDIDNSIRLLMFWSNLGIEGDIRTLDIDSVRREQKAVCNKILKVGFDHEVLTLKKLNESGKYVDDYEFLQSKRVDNLMMKHRIDMRMNRNFDNIRLKATEYNKIDEMDNWEISHQRRTTVKSGLIFVGKIILYIAILMFSVMMGPNVDSYAGLDHDQERNHEPNRGDVNFDDEVHGGLAHVINTHVI
ncbi:25807_t:CDS:2, partial [Gigaspora rosea]